MGDREGLAIRSFRVVFNLERRIHKVDRWRIPTPYGVPLRGIAYCVAALVAIVLLGRLPVAGQLTGILPPPIRFVILPLGVAFVLTRLRVDGRPAHTAIASWLRFGLSPSRLAGLRAVPRAGAVVRLDDVAVVPDERSARYRSAVIEGPVTLLLRYPPVGSVTGRRRPVLHVSQLAGPPLFVGKHVRLRDRQRIVLHG
jgi:TcpE family